MSLDHKKMVKIAQGALDHHEVKCVFVDGFGNCFLPKDLDKANLGFTQPAYSWDGKTLHRLEAATAIKLDRSVDGSTYIGKGLPIPVGKAEPEVKAEETTKADADAKTDAKAKTDADAKKKADADAKKKADADAKKKADAKSEPSKPAEEAGTDKATQGKP